MSDLQDMSEVELAKSLVGFNESSPTPTLIRQELQRRLINEQHNLNKENILLQESLNTKTVDKQIRLMKITAFLTAASTLVAALAGAYLAYALTQTQKPLQIKLDSEQFAQLQKAQQISVIDLNKILGKSPLKPPTVKPK
jgi:hypothetical protein